MTTMRTRLKSATTSENAAPCANEIASCVYPEISPAPRLSTQSVACSWIWMPLEPVRVEPALQPIDVLLGTGAPGGVLERDVVVDALGRRARLIDDDAAEGEHDEPDGRGEDEEDERDREPTGQPQPLAGPGREG